MSGPQRAFVVVLMLGCARTSAADDADRECQPAAVVRGDRVLAQRLAARLDAIGVTSSPLAGCRRVIATIEPAGEMISLSLDNGYGQTGTRTVRDISTAAALIASWTRQEAVDLALAPLPVEAAPPVEPAVRRDTPAIRTASRPGPALITAAFETIRSEDSSIWAGASFAACVRAGPLCLGAGGSAASDIHLSGQQDHPRTSLDVVATAEVPLTLAGIDVSPGVGLGYAWVRTGGTGPHQDISVTHGGWRGDARLTIGRRVVRRWSVELGLRADRIIGGDESAPALFPANQLRVGVGLRYGGS